MKLRVYTILIKPACAFSNSVSSSKAVLNPTKGVKRSSNHKPTMYVYKSTKSESGEFNSIHNVSNEILLP